MYRQASTKYGVFSALLCTQFVSKCKGLIWRHFLINRNTVIMTPWCPTACGAANIVINRLWEIQEYENCRTIQIQQGPEYIISLHIDPFFVQCSSILLTTHFVLNCTILYSLKHTALTLLHSVCVKTFSMSCFRVSWSAQQVTTHSTLGGGTHVWELSHFAASHTHSLTVCTHTLTHLLIHSHTHSLTTCTHTHSHTQVMYA